MSTHQLKGETPTVEFMPCSSETFQLINGYLSRDKLLVKKSRFAEQVKVSQPTLWAWAKDIWAFNTTFRKTWTKYGPYNLFHVFLLSELYQFWKTQDEVPRAVRKAFIQKNLAHIDDTHFQELFSCQPANPN